MPKRYSVEVDFGAQADRAVAQFSRKLRQALDLKRVDLGLDNLAQEARTAEQEVARLSREVSGIGDKKVSVDLDTGNAEAKIREVEDIIQRIDDQTVTVDVELDQVGLQQQLSGLASGGGLTGLLSSVGGPIGVAFGGAITAGITGAIERESLQASLRAAGFSEAEASELGDQAGELYGTGFSASIEESFAVTGRAARSLKSFGVTSEDAIGQASQSLLTLQNVFNTDIDESIRAAERLVRNNLAGSFEEAFDIIITGFQSGPIASSNDFIETLIEYPGFFDEAGLSAADFLSLLESGLEGGARNTDLVADALKELTALAQTESKAVSEAFDILGISQTEYLSNTAQGGAAARDATLGLLDAVQSVEDPLQRTTVESALLGTRAEELAGAFDGLSVGSVRFEEIEGAASAANEELATTATRLQRIRAQLENGAAAAPAALIEVANAEDADQLADALARLNDATGGQGSFWDPFIGGAREWTDALGLTTSEAEKAAAAQLEVEKILLRNAAADYGDRVERGSASFDNYAQAARDARNALVELELIDFQPVAGQLDLSNVNADEQRQAIQSSIDAPILFEAKLETAALAEQASEDLAGELSQIDSQLTLSVNVDEDDGVNDVEEIIASADALVEEFNRRREAAAQADLLGLDAVAERIRSGEYDGIIDDVLDGEGGTTDALLADLEASLAGVSEVQAAAAAEAAAVAKLAFGEALLSEETGTDPFAELIANAALTPEDFVEFADSVQAGLGEALQSEAALEAARENGRAIAADFLAGLEIGLAENAGLVSAALSVADTIEAAVAGGLGVQSPSTVGIEIGGFFDEGIAIGLSQGRSEEAAARIAEQIGSIKIDLSGVFNVDAEQLDARGPYEQILDNIRSAEADAAAELDQVQDRLSASDRIAQFGGLDLLQEAVDSGQFDALLDTIINNPNEAAFRQINEELARAQGITIDDVVDGDELAADGARVGAEFGFNVIEGFRRGVDTASPEGSVLAQLAAAELAALRDVFGIESPSTVMQEIGMFLEQGLALGINGGLTGEAIRGLQEEIVDTELNLLTLDNTEDYLEDVLDLYRETWEELAPEIGELFVDGASSVDASPLTARFNAAASAADPGGILSGLVGAADLSAEIGLDVDTNSLDVLADQSFNADVIASLDATALEQLLEDEYGIEIDARLDVDDTELQTLSGQTVLLDIDFAIDADAVEAQIQAAIDAGDFTLIFGTPGGITGGQEQGAFFDNADVRRFERGGFVGFNPGPGVPFQMPSGGVGIMGESWRGPEVAEYGPNGLAIVGGYHDDQLTDDRLRAAGIDLEPLYRARIEASQPRFVYDVAMPAADTGSAAASQIAALTNEVASLSSQLADISRHTGATAGSAASIADSSSDTATAVVDMATAKPAKPSARSRGRVIGA